MQSHTAEVRGRRLVGDVELHTISGPTGPISASVIVPFSNAPAAVVFYSIPTGFEAEGQHIKSHRKRDLNMLEKHLN